MGKTLSPNTACVIGFTKKLRVFFAFFLLLVFSKAFAQEKTIAGALQGISTVEKLNNKASEKISEIEATIAKVESSKAYKTLVDGKLELPYAIVKDNPNSGYALYVNKVDLNAVTGMTAEIMMKIPVSSGKSLYFLADKVPLSQKGKLLGEMNLYLLKTDSTTIGEGYSIIFKGLDNPNKAYSYVTFDCKGFKEVFINGKLEFDANSIVEPQEKGKAKKPFGLDFFINADRIANLVVQFSDVPTFEFASLPGFKCTVKKITLDKSDLRNAPNFKLPDWYIDSLQVKEPNIDKVSYTSELWQGVYIPEILIEIPKEFENESGSKAVTINAQSLIVDQYGLTAFVSAKGGVLNGDLKGFKYSVDSLRLNLIANSLSRAGFYGGMSFPICKEDSKIGYGLTISKGVADGSKLEYQGYATLTTNLNVQAFGLAQLGLQRCDIDFAYKNEQFFPKVTLDGSLTIAPKSKNDSTPSGNIGLEFGGLIISSEAGYISKVKEGFFIRTKTGDLTSKMAGLPITIKDATFKEKNNGQDFGLGFTLEINLQNSSGEDTKSSSGFSGEASMVIWAQRNASTKKWKYKDFELSQINIEADLGAVKAEGSLTMFNGDKVYGKGFCGNLKIDIIDKIKVEAAAIFGKVTNLVEQDTLTIYNMLVNGENVSFSSNEEETTVSKGSTQYRYWFMDARVSFTPGIPIGTGIEINAFTGGIYYNMSMVKPQNEGSIETKVECKTVTGRKYIPQPGILGLIAGIGVQSTGTGTVFNGDINFGIEFNLPDFGVARIATWGGVKFMEFKFSPSGVESLGSKMSLSGLTKETKESTKSSTPPSSYVAANWFVQYDFNDKTLQGDFDIYIDFGGVIKGSQGDNKAGRISIYSSAKNKEWYIYVGRPIQGDMIGVEVLKLAEIGGYFCVGSVLPDPPIAPMPPEINPRIDIDNSLLGMGGGMSFGGRLRIEGNPGVPLAFCNLRAELHFLVLAGFDLLISQSKEPVYCADVGDRGINRWYATGQAYIYGEATLRASYDCWMGSNTVNILSMYLKAYVFAQLPHPSYLKGGVEVGFKVLKKRFKAGFDVELGETCSSDVLENDVAFIEAIDPADGNENVSVSSPITVYFKHSIEKFTYHIKNSDKESTIYRAYIEKSGLTVMHGSKAIDFEFEYGNDNRQIVITPLKVMPGNAAITVTVNVFTQYLFGKEWKTINAEPETQVVTFKTAAEPTIIPIKDIYYSYPLPDMENFYMNESRNGYIRLAVLPDKSVKLAKGYEFNLAIFEGENEIGRTRTVTYTGAYGQNNFSFNIPNMSMETNKKYKLKVMKSPIPDPTMQSSTQSGSTTAGAVAVVLKDTVILEYNFTTSTSKTFESKMSELSSTFSQVFDGVIAANLTINKSTVKAGMKIESLSSVEMNGYLNQGVQTTDPLIQFVNMDYTNESKKHLDEILKEVKDLDLTWGGITSGGASIATNVISSANSFLKGVNMSCLIEGGCSGKDLKNVVIPAGTFTLNIGYFLPGQDVPVSKHSIAINLDKQIKLPN